jgi:excisionase family DNA binding protein
MPSEAPRVLRAAAGSGGARAVPRGSDPARLVVLTPDELREHVREAVADALAEFHAEEAPRPELLTVEQLCHALQISRATLHRLREEGLPELRLGDSLRFRMPDVLTWIEQRSRKREGG